MSKDIKIVIGCDHAAPDMKNAVKEMLLNKGYAVTDVGTFDSTSCDYPDIARALCEKIQSGSHQRGILICGTGIGMSIAANKHIGIRAACCSDAYSAELTRKHNDSNVLCFGARVVDTKTALLLSSIFVETEFEGGRHQTRVNKLAEIEAEQSKINRE